MYLSQNEAWSTHISQIKKINFWWMSIHDKPINYMNNVNVYPADKQSNTTDTFFKETSSWNMGYIQPKKDQMEPGSGKNWA